MHIGKSGATLPEPLPIRRRERQSKARAETAHVVVIGGPRRVARMTLQRPLRSLATDRQSTDDPITAQIHGRKTFAPICAAVVQQVLANALVKMEVDAAFASVVQDEVPGPIARPREQTIHLCVD